ncbi:MAG: YceI family protein [Rhodanobacteraceae bacterium]
MKLRLAPALAAAGLATAPGVRAEAVVYRFDPPHTQIFFSADHQKFSHPVGRLKVKDGWFQFDDKDFSSAKVDVEIDMKSADMGDDKWNETIRGGQLLDADKYPTARYTSKSVEKKGDNGGVIHGDLTLHGATKPVDVEFTLNRVANDPYRFRQKAGFSAKATIKRADFGISRYTEVIGESIELRFEIEGLKDGGAAKEAGEEKKPDAG